MSENDLTNGQVSALYRALIYAVMALLLSVVGSCAAYDSYSEYLDTEFKIACVQAGKNYEVLDLDDRDTVEAQEVCR